MDPTTKLPLQLPRDGFILKANHRRRKIERSVNIFKSFYEHQMQFGGFYLIFFFF